jgi:hypothetical protein
MEIALTGLASSFTHRQELEVQKPQQATVLLKDTLLKWISSESKRSVSPGFLVKTRDSHRR